MWSRRVHPPTRSHQIRGDMTSREAQVLPRKEWYRGAERLEAGGWRQKQRVFVTTQYTSIVLLVHCFKTLEQALFRERFNSISNRWKMWPYHMVTCVFVIIDIVQHFSPEIGPRLTAGLKHSSSWFRIPPGVEWDKERN